MTNRQKMMLILLLGAQFMLSVDFSILNVALPDVGRALHFSLTNLQWISTTFSLMAAGLTLFFGRVADLFGRRQFFLASMILLGVGSLLGGLATNAAMLLLARTLQGIATAMVTPVAFALLTTSFEEGALRDRALGLNGALLSAGFTVGSILGGVLTSLFSWRWAFFINVPVAFFIALFTPRYIREIRTQRIGHIDGAGALTVTIGLLSLVYGVTSFGQTGLRQPTTVISLVSALLALGAFWVLESKSRRPLLALRVLMQPTVKWGSVSTLTILAMETSMVFLTTLYLQKVLGLQPALTGAAFGVLGLTAFAAGIIMPKYINRFGSRRFLTIGLVGQGLTTLLLALTQTGRGWLWFVLVVSALNGFLHMMALVSSMVTATSGLNNSDEGSASSIISMMQLTGISLGIPLMSAVLTARTNVLTTLSAKYAFLYGYHDAILVDGAIAVGVGLLVAFCLRLTSRTSSPTLVAEELE